jgi:hypothetical protein
VVDRAARAYMGLVKNLAEKPLMSESMEKGVNATGSKGVLLLVLSCPSRRLSVYRRKVETNSSLAS